MSNTHQDNFERLLNEAVDGSLSESDALALEAVLRDDPAARKQYLRFMQLHALLEWDHGAEAALLSPPSDESASPSPRSAFRSRIYSVGLSLLTIAAAALLVYVALDWRYHRQSSVSVAAIAHVESVQGSARFRSGLEEQALTTETDIAAGTLLLDGETSAVQVRFLDGTLITLSGQSEAAIADDGQKQVRLRHGVLTAEVQPQPVDAPLIVETPTARVAVLGTVFTVAAEPEQTRVSVDAGRVRVERLVDGATREIPSAQSWVASLNRSDTAEPSPRAESAPGWHYSFSQPGPESWKGKWLAAEAGDPARVLAAPCVVGRRNSSTPLVHYGLTVRKTAEVSLGTLPDEGVLRLKYRMREPAPLFLMLSVHKPSGAFGGNFEHKMASEQSRGAEAGWQVLEIPLASFDSVIPRYPTIAPESRPNLIMITTFEKDCGLEVAEISISATEAAQE